MKKKEEEVIRKEEKLKSKQASIQKKELDLDEREKQIELLEQQVATMERELEIKIQNQSIVNSRFAAQAKHKQSVTYSESAYDDRLRSPDENSGKLETNHLKSNS